MLQITISEKPERELFNEATSEFIQVPGHKAFPLQLEHSLISLSKWESKWKKPFLGSKESLTREEILDYVRCMTINGGIDEEAYQYIDNQELKQILDYMSDSHTATKIYDRRNHPQRQETITSELIYYWMIRCEIPQAYEKWHLNRLLTLIKVCNIKGGPDQKMSKQSIYNQNRELNARRRAKLHSRG